MTGKAMANQRSTKHYTDNYNTMLSINRKVNSSAITETKTKKKKKKKKRTKTKKQQKKKK